MEAGCRITNWVIIYMKLLLGMAFLMVLLSCSDNDAAKDTCPITVDSVAIIDSLKQGDMTYYLVHRISGWSDKTEILELYDSKPVFDVCSRSNIEPVYGDSLEMDQTISHVYLNIKEGVLDIEYKNSPPDKNNNARLKLELK